jgi:hypothetical protein
MLAVAISSQNDPKTSYFSDASKVQLMLKLPAVSDLIAFGLFCKRPGHLEKSTVRSSFRIKVHIFAYEH